MSDEKRDLVPCEDGGFSVYLPGYFVGYVFPDAFGGWRPYDYYGRPMNSGRPALRTPQTALQAGLEAV